MLNAQLVLPAEYAEFFRRNFCFAMFRIVEKKDELQIAIDYLLFTL